MDVGITVEERPWKQVLGHGMVAGLIAGIALGLVQFVISAAFQESALTPFRLVASLVLGPEALADTMSTGLVMLVGGGLHLLLAGGFGAVFAVLLSVGWQLSARRWVLLAYGLLFGFLLYEINFLAVLPGLYPGLADQFGLENQLWKGIAAYTLVYGPVMAVYLSVVRPGVRAPWTEKDLRALSAERA